MADLLIKGMEKPTTCLSCPLNSVQICRVLHRVVAINGKYDDCPLVEVDVSHRVNLRGEWEEIWVTKE